MRFEKIEYVEYDTCFFKRAQDKEFSKSEEFVVEVLSKTGMIENFRRGDADLYEADLIVDEKVQIEIVNCFNSANDLLRFKKASPSILLLDSTNTGRYKLPVGVIKKFISKSYTEKYDLSLAILLIGSPETVGHMLDALKYELENNNTIKNHFKKIYFVVFNACEDEVACITNEKTIKTDLRGIKNIPYKKGKKELDELEDEVFYIMSCNNIFENQKVLFYETGKTLKGLIKEMNIWM